jgi:proteasome lid subunit RPN8/RPN11
MRRALVDEMLAHVLRCLPEEACGLVAGRGERALAVIPVTNAAHSRARFRMDPREQVAALHAIERDGLDLLAIYHSHPAGPSGPSGTDLREAAYPEAAYLIWSVEGDGWRLRAFDLRGPAPTEIRVEVAEGRDPAASG